MALVCAMCFKCYLRINLYNYMTLTNKTAKKIEAMTFFASNKVIFLAKKSGTLAHTTHAAHTTVVDCISGCGWPTS